MNLELDSKELNDKLNSRKYNLNMNNLINNLNNSFNLSKMFLREIIKNQNLEMYVNLKVGQNSPLKWAFGNLIYFWNNLILNNLGYNFLRLSDVYDPFKTKYDSIFKCQLIDCFTLINNFDLILSKITNHIVHYDVLPYIDSYLIKLGLINHSIQNENFLSIINSLNLNTLNINLKNYKFTPFKNEMIDVPEGNFLQGCNSGFYFDNEYPSFVNRVSNFSISKYCITNYEYLKFVDEEGYKNDSYWLREAILWKKKNKINSPVYWKLDNKKNIWLENIFGKYYPLRLNDPVKHISYYEASAYCKWAGCRLPKESEWEYLTTFFYEDYKCDANFNYKNGVISVLEDKNENTLGIVGLYGNVWEWCLEPFYPYDGFVIDPVYREKSYPYFGFKRICRGGSWCVPDYLVTKSYRNAQPMDCRIQYIGFRIVKDYF